ncbi:hypothetical protein JHK87_051389 [Glycine soja]|nr:hypothetical protein JHK87_051389 [Glycine soja]
MTTLPSPSLLFTLPNLKFSKTRAQCVNGLLCIHPKCTVKFSSRVNAFTLVANPTTRQVITLPLDQSIDKDFASQLILDTTLIKMSSKFLAWLCIKVVLIMRSSSGVMPAPPRYLEGVVWNLKHLNLMEIHGCLCLPGHTYNNSRNLKLWILMDYMWEQQKSVVLPSRVIFPLCRVPTGEILLLPYFLDRCVGEAYCDMDTTSSRSLVVMEMPCDPLWGDHTLVDFDIFYSQESFRLLTAVVKRVFAKGAGTEVSFTLSSKYAMDPAKKMY